MTFWNLAFAWINPWFGAFMGGVGIFAAWLLHFAALVNGSTLTELLGRESLSAAVRTFILLLLDSPWPLLVIGGIIAALVYFNDHANWWMRRFIGISHALAHVLIYCALLIVLARLLPASRWGDVWLVISMGAATFVTASTIMGIYLLVGLNVFNGHWNEAFSSLRVEKYKGFLRLKIDRAGTLTVYPIVTDEVEETKLAPRLVEEPIVLKKQARGPVTAHATR